MLPISKMELVVFAVVLILPALLRGGFLSGTGINDCMEILADCGEMKCLLEGSGNFSDFDPHSCTFICEGRPWPPLPRGICSEGGINCSTSVREGLSNWHYKLEHALHEVLTKK
uniref:Putative secreted protein n=1 Tax=Ixodes ricinus TaxID=34613 RepID=V5H9I3_IXORI